MRACIDRRQHAGRRNAARVMRVEMDRQADLFLQGCHEQPCRLGPALAAHVLDTEHVRACGPQLTRGRASFPGEMADGEHGDGGDHDADAHDRQTPGGRDARVDRRPRVGRVTPGPMDDGAHRFE